MKVHQQFARALLDLHLNYHHSDHKLLRPLAPKPHTSSTVDLKSFIKPDKKDSSPQAVETTTLHLGGTRWNPTQEQIGILEMLYKGGMRTPNAHQIEQITTQLSNYGKIEGKNVFYWFQNHKARERQKQKRSSITLNFDTSTKSKEESVRFEQGSGKRKCRTWPSECLSQGEITRTITADDNPKISSKLNSEIDEEEEELGMKSRTLNLFPLHPEGRLMMGIDGCLY